MTPNAEYSGARDPSTAEFVTAFQLGALSGRVRRCAGGEAGKQEICGLPLVASKLQYVVERGGGSENARKSTLLTRFATSLVALTVDRARCCPAEQR